MSEPNFSIKTEVEEKNFGRYSIEPLTQGYGQTLGNSLRRVLLTSLSGNAITTVKIEGVKHQFATLPGLKEDVVEFLLNVKKIRLMLEGSDTATMKLVKHGPGVITARDIEVSAGVTIMNPDLILGTLADKKATIDMQLTVQKGFGYMTADEQHNDEIGVIPLDALYSPIIRVNYHVEATRVGRMTNLDKLILEIWTDGTKAPLDALKNAASILVSYFSQIVEPKVVVKEDAVVVSTAVSDETVKMRIEELDIPTRIVNALSNGGIETIGQMLATPRAELMKIKNLGAKSITIIEDKLKEKSVTLTV
ncbi:MAG: DNA-directed RNA polymerase subunit alpha, DNA-directed RNA polymerase subunit alpha [Microgenomates group bacterium GW2011_GWC1_39_12]|nr:MAG: DNA-directed RNA polymerase subunit alpha, DNA-directed RNA polymerase subunit alpha [Microgenomates group bacterium GW2011_GWC1_39_12]